MIRVATQPLHRGCSSAVTDRHLYILYMAILFPFHRVNVNCRPFLYGEAMECRDFYLVQSISGLSFCGPFSEKQTTSRRDDWPASQAEITRQFAAESSHSPGHWDRKNNRTCVLAQSPLSGPDATVNVRLIKFSSVTVWPNLAQPTGRPSLHCEPQPAK
jgi:hypothetical protein